MSKAMLNSRNGLIWLKYVNDSVFNEFGEAGAEILNNELISEVLPTFTIEPIPTINGDGTVTQQLPSESFARTLYKTRYEVHIKRIEKVKEDRRRLAGNSYR